jgi:hypothetical protein
MGDDPNPYAPPHAPTARTESGAHSSRAGRAPLIGAIVGAVLLVPPYVLLFVWGRRPDPNRSDPWGWCIEAILSGVAAGVVIGGMIGGFVGVVVGLVIRVFNGSGREVG